MNPMLLRSAWPAAIALCCWLAPAAAVAQRTFADVDRVDVVPRGRLVTDRELFALLDPSHAALAPVRHALSVHDTTRALQQLAAYFRQRTAPRYFFTPAEVAARAHAYARLYPEQVAEARSNVQRFRAQYGADVDWMMPGKDREGAAHTPNTIRWLARQWEAESIALLHRLDGPRAGHRALLLEHVRDFVRDYESGRAEAGDNDVFERFYAGHRTRNWVSAHYLLLGSPDYGSEDQVLMLRVFLLHGARLVDQSLRFNWGNHQLHGLAGLYELSILYPEFPVMRAWNAQALGLLLEHLQREVAADGMQAERSSHYHLLDILNYFRVYRIAQLNGVVLPEWYLKRFRGMFDAVVALALPTRVLPILQDVSDSAWVTMNWPQQEMAIGAMLFEDPVYRYFATERLPASLYWFFDEGAPARYAALHSRAPATGSVALPQSGYYVMRSGWDADDLYLLIDGGLARDKPDHTHGGVLGVIGYGFGEQLLPNYSVLYRDPSYSTAKNSLVKNVALVDGMLQGRGWIDNGARTGFGIWTRLPVPTVHEWIAGNAFDYFRGSHDGYEDAGVQYARSILFLKPHYWLFLDEFTGERAHSFQQIWQGRYAAGNHDRGTSYQPSTAANPNRAVQERGSARLAILQADPAAMRLEARRLYYTESVEFEKRGERAYGFTTIVRPSRAAETALPEVQRFERPEFTEITVRDGTRRDHVFIGKRPDFTVAGVEARGQLVVLRYDGDRLSAVLLHAGSRLQLAEFTAELPSAATIEWYRGDRGEWSVRLLQGEVQVVEMRMPDGTTRRLELRAGAASTTSGGARE
jgi:hypothetical protein